MNKDSDTNYNLYENNIETSVFLNASPNLEEIVANQIRNWIENVVLKVTRSMEWIHIHKSLDELYINVEGYNTPPLAIKF